MPNKYAPILSDTTRDTFFDYTDSLDIPEIDYFAIGLQKNKCKSSISLMSRPEWQKHFITNQYAAYDPIRKVALNTKRNLIPFSEIDFVDSFGAEIMRQRALMGIKNGIILMNRTPKFNYMITLATEFSKFDPFRFITTYHKELQILKIDFAKIIEKDAKNFLL